MSLSVKAIDRLFERLGATYGREWSNLWDGMPISDVKTLWAHELSRFSERLEDIAWALENLPPRAPNAIEFKQLVRQAPRNDKPLALHEPIADPARVQAELAKLTQIQQRSHAKHDYKGWAKRILAKHEAGQHVLPICLSFAREALRENLTRRTH